MISPSWVAFLNPTYRSAISLLNQHMSNDKEQNPLQEEVIKPFKQFFDFRKFWNTRKAILSGVPLYDWDSSQRQKSGYLNHWNFNIQESTLAALPVILLTKVLDFLFDKFKDKPLDIASLDERTKVFIETAQATDQFFSAFATPAFLTLLVFLLAWGSLKGSDSTPEKRARAARAYLYFDGAYGLYFQLLLSLVFSLMTWGSNHTKLVEKLPPFVSFVLVILFIVGLIGQLIETNKTIPRKLFKVNGYSFRVKHFWQRKHPDDPPWSKYSFALILAGWPVIIVVSVVLTTLSYITATVLTSIKMLFV